jgi:hypothetical protein
MMFCPPVPVESVGWCAMGGWLTAIKQPAGILYHDLVNTVTAIPPVSAYRGKVRQFRQCRRQRVSLANGGEMRPGW